MQVTEISQKVIPFQDAADHFARIREEGHRIVQCHGTFDLLHPGHMIHLEEAAAMGDRLVVTVTAEDYVNKGPGRPYFNDHLRARSLASLACVDFVVLIPFTAAIEAIECVKPHVYCKGKEYEDPQNDPTGNIQDDVTTVEKHGGEVRYVGSVVFSSTRLLNRHFDTFENPVKDFCRELANTCTPDQFRDHVDHFAGMRVLVVGDVIFDRYTTVKVQGLTSKDRIISGRLLNDQLQTGGALAVYRHLRAFTDQVKLVSLVGQEPWANRELASVLPKEHDGVVRAEGFTSIVKRRFVEPLSEGKELQKLFATNTIDADEPDRPIRKQLLSRLYEELEQPYDLVLVMDFGHGVMGEAMRDLVQVKASWLALNCQTNSNNHGFNVINRQYHRADSFSLDMAELRLASGRRDVEGQPELTAVRNQLNSSIAWLTRGPNPVLALDAQDQVCHAPCFENNVVDAIGAGDSFCAAASLASAAKLPMPLATFMGQLAAAQAVTVVGNAEATSKTKFVKGGMAMLNF